MSDIELLNAHAIKMGIPTISFECHYCGAKASIPVCKNPDFLPQRMFMKGFMTYTTEQGKRVICCVWCFDCIGYAKSKRYEREQKVE